MSTQAQLRDSVCELLAYFDSAGFARQTQVFRIRENNLPYWSVQNYLRGKRSGAASVTEGIGSGLSRDPLLAMLSAIGESAERFYLSVRPECLQVCRARDLSGGRALSAAEWPTFTAAQLRSPNFPFRCYDPDEAHTWACLTSLLSGEPRWVPAELVWVTPVPNRFAPGISTGAASHTESDAALLSGLYEVVERDAFTIMWESRAVTPLLDPMAVFQVDEVRAMAAFFRNLDIRLILRNITTDLEIPSVLAILHDNSKRRPALALGAASRATIGEACRKAAEEAYHTWTWMTDEHLKSEVSWAETLASLEMPDVMMRHPYLYGFPQSISMASHLLADAPVISPRSEVSFSPVRRDQLRSVVEHLAQRGHEPMVCDLVPSAEVDRNPLSVVKLIVPGLVPLSIGRSGRMLANPRIAGVPTRMGWPHVGLHTTETWVPHPFP